jgi:hypothetical protein
MKNFNPHEWARQKQEDPEIFMKENLYEHKQKLILRHASLPAEMRPTDHQLVHSDDEAEDDADGEPSNPTSPHSFRTVDGGADLEAIFLSTLSSNEKRHLLVHLEVSLSLSLSLSLSSL